MRPVDERHHHVLEGRHPRQEIEVLEDEADLPAAQPGPLGLAEPRDVPTVEPVSAARRPVEEAQQIDQRRLARAGEPISATISPRAIESDTPLEHGYLIAPRSRPCGSPPAG